MDAMVASPTYCRRQMYPWDQAQWTYRSGRYRMWYENPINASAWRCTQNSTHKIRTLVVSFEEGDHRTRGLRWAHQPTKPVLALKEPENNDSVAEVDCVIDIVHEVQGLWTEDKMRTPFEHHQASYSYRPTFSLTLDALVRFHDFALLRWIIVNTCKMQRI